jgi:transitional endoplasmic reticulum ATPase
MVRDAVPVWTIRDFAPSDLDDAVRVWDESHDTEARPLFGVAEVIDAFSQGEPAIVASVSGRIIGTVIARVTGERAWILRIAIVKDWRGRGLGSDLLRSLEDRLVRLGVRRIASILPVGEVGHAAFEHQGYRLVREVEYVERLEPVRAADHALLGELGAQRLGPERWDDLLGMHDAKQIIERSIVLPLVDREVAVRHGVQLPRAAILFGPPGTGKTTFAKGVAGRLGWPFVEIFPSRLASDGPHGRPAALREVFEQVSHLEHVVLFIDEVDEIASSRAARKDTEGVVNELLKAIPVFRGQDGRLLICATNSVRDLDQAFLRPGRFDFVIPIGPPDTTAREALLDRFVRAITTLPVDVEGVARETDRFTTADIELVARKAAQASFERAVAEGRDSPATTDDFLIAARTVRPTLSADQLREFAEDIETYGRW